MKSEIQFWNKYILGSTSILLPRYLKDEAIEAVCAEYERLGNPLDNVNVTPEEAIAHVVQALSAAGHNQAPPPPEETGEEPMDESNGVDGEPVIMPEQYTVQIIDGEWHLGGMTTNGLVHYPIEAPTDPPQGLGFYQIVFIDGEAHVSDGVEPVSCPDLWLGFITSTDNSGSAPSGGANDVGTTVPGRVWLS